MIKSTSSLFVIVSLLSVLLLTSLLSLHPHQQQVEALFGPNITLTLTDPGTLSTTYSPRRVAVQVVLFFSSDSNIIGPVEATIPVTAASTACRFTRFYWLEAGTFNAPLEYEITFRNPILTWNAFEQDAFDAMSVIYMTVGASSRARIIDSNVCVFFEKLTVIEIDSALRSFQAAEARCINTNGGFLATLLKPTDEADVLSALSSTGTQNYWIGGYAVDNRPGDTLYCWRADPDFEESGCNDGGYYSYFRVLNAGGASTSGADTAGVNCIRPTGFACSGYDFNWDGTGSGETWNMRLNYDGTANWLHWDRSMNRTTAGHTLGHICTGIASYERTPGVTCHNPTIIVDNPSLTRSVTPTLSRSSSVPDTKSRTGSGSKSKSFSTSHSFTKSVSKTVSRSLSFSRSVTFSKSLSRSRITPSLSFSESTSRSRSQTARSVSPSTSDEETITRSKTFTLVSRTKILTMSKSHSITGGSRTPSFLYFDTCSEGWIRFGRYCFKHFPLTVDRSNESLPTPMTFADSLRYCEDVHGATIVPIQNEAMLLFLQEQVVGENTGRRFWNGVYQDTRFKNPEQTWRTVYNRTGFNDFFHWDTRRRMPQFDDCIVHHMRGNLGARIVGGNNAMVTYPCDGRAEVVCGRLQDPWSVTSINQTNSGPLLAIEGHYLTLSIVGRRLPRTIGVQLQTTTYDTHSGPEGQPTHCAQTKPRSTIPMNASNTPVFAQNITRTFSFDTFCNGTCDRTILRFPPPETLGLVRGHKYSFCFFFPYDYDTPLSSDEFRWDFLPNLYLEVAQSQRNFKKETCERRSHLIDLLYFDQTATDSTRVVPTPWYFDGPLQSKDVFYKPGLE